MKVNVKAIRSAFITSVGLMKRKMSTVRPIDALQPKIQLTDSEINVTTLLTEFINQYNINVTNNDEKIESRITGGWVRDKLLGYKSNDLDIAINTMTGEEFAELLNEYLSKNESKYGINAHNIHKIEKNPEKSKHLETATTKLYGLDIDFVNLRSEEYTEESRIPKIKCGTPEEDALRRDATLNALFYNIRTGEVEDFTKNGLRDLKNGLLRTPLKPLKTFLDDPLRVLRLIRFASRFDFRIENETLDAMKNPSIRVVLLNKISRERIGTELEKILKTSDPYYGFQLIHDTNLIEPVFNFGALQTDVESLNSDRIEEILEITHKVSEETPKVIKTLQSFKANEIELSTLIHEFITDPTKNKLIWFSLILSPWGATKVRFAPSKKTAFFAAELIMKEGVKCPKNDAEACTKVISTIEQYRNIVERASELKRSELGLFLKPYGDSYQLALVVNALQEIVEGNDTSSVLTKYQKFDELIKERDLLHVSKLKSLINGKDLSKKLNKKPGPWMKDLNDRIFIWQLDNPSKSAEDCFEYVQSIVN